MARRRLHLGLHHGGRRDHLDAPHPLFSAAPIIFGVGTVGVLYTMASWWGDVIKEAQYKGDHTRVVQIATATA